MTIEELFSGLGSVYQRQGHHFIKDDIGFTSVLRGNDWFLDVWTIGDTGFLKDLKGEIRYTGAPLQNLVACVWDQITTEKAEIIANMIEELEDKGRDNFPF